MKQSVPASAYFLTATYSAAWAMASASGSSSQSGSGSGDAFDSMTDTKSSELPKPSPTYPNSIVRTSNAKSSTVPVLVGIICGVVLLIAVVGYVIGRRRRDDKPRGRVEYVYDSDQDDFVFQSVKPAPRESRKSVRWSVADPNTTSVPLQVVTSPVNPSNNQPVVSAGPAVGLTIYEEDHVTPPTSPLDASNNLNRHTIAGPPKSHKRLTISSLRRHTMMERPNDDCDSLYNSFLSDDLFATSLPNSGDRGIPTSRATMTHTTAVHTTTTGTREKARSLSNVCYEL